MAVNRRLAGAGLLAVGLAAALAGGLTISALASTVAETYPLTPAGFTVGGIAVLLALVVPVGVSTGILRAMRSRGYTPAPSAVAGLTLLLTNLAWIVGIQVASPVPVRVLVAERGTWVVDAMLGSGPFGPAALPVLSREIVDLQDAQTLAVAAPMWCDETAGGFAVGLADGLRNGAPAALSDALGDILVRHGVGVDQPGGAVANIPEDLDGQGLLDDVRDIASAFGPAVDLPPLVASDLTPGVVERKRIEFASGWEARYEHGAWRWCTGTVRDAATRGHAYAAAIRLEQERAPVAAGPAAGPWDRDVRAALQAAAFGRSAWLAGVSTVGPDFGNALTQTAAAAQAEKIRNWCTQAAEDPARKTAVESVASRWTLPAPGKAVDASVQALLEAQGRRYLEDVLAACGPVAGDRQVREAARGLNVPDAQRRRWAELEARNLASAATLSDNGTGGVKVEVDGRTLVAVQEDGAWRIDWRD
ncbi:MAG: hypothetical protein R3F59_25005 [Myxococcota bacterium]